MENEEVDLDQAEELWESGRIGWVEPGRRIWKLWSRCCGSLSDGEMSNLRGKWMSDVSPEQTRGWASLWGASVSGWSFFVDGTSDIYLCIFSPLSYLWGWRWDGVKVSEEKGALLKTHEQKHEESGGKAGAPVWKERLWVCLPRLRNGSFFSLWHSCKINDCFSEMVI